MPATLTVSREPFLVALSMLRSGVERRNAYPILSHILLESDGEKASLTSSNLETEITTVVGLTGGTPCATTLPAAKLYDIVRLAPAESAIALAIDKSTSVVSYGRSRYKLHNLPAGDFPRTREITDAVRWSMPECALLRLLRDVSPSMGVEDVRYYLNGALFELEGSALRVVSTDGHRLAVSKAESGETSGAARQIVSRHAVSVLARTLSFGEDAIQVALGSSQIEVRKGDTVIRSRLIDGKYPDYGKVIPSSQPVRVKIEREALLEALSRVLVVSDEKTRGVRLRLTTGSLQMSAINQQEESCEETLAAQYEGKELAVGFNGSYLAQALDTLPDREIVLGLRDDSGAATIQSAGGGGALFVVMPLRL